MNISFKIDGQSITSQSPAVKVSETVNYFQAVFQFSSEWNGLKKYAHFTHQGKTYDKEIINDKIETGLDFKAGSYTVWVHGVLYDGETLVKRITTNKTAFHIIQSGMTVPGQPFPQFTESLGEQIVRETTEARDAAREYSEQASAASEVAMSSADVAVKAKESSEQAAGAASLYANNAETFAINAESSSKEAKTYFDKAELSAGAAQNAANQSKTYSDKAEQSLQELKDGIANGNFKGETGEQGPKGDPFTYSDFTSEQLEGLRGPVGPKGDAGEQGPQGKTPVKGVDYFTSADKDQFVEEVSERLDLTETRQQATEAKETAERAESIAKGKATGYVFDTEVDMRIWLNENREKLNVGDNLYIRAIDTPDYWWDGSDARKLETEKVDLSGLAKTEDIPKKLSDLTADTTHRTVTDAEKETWNSKSDFSGNYEDLSNKPEIPEQYDDTELKETIGVISADIRKLTNTPPEGTDPVPEWKIWGTTADGADWVDVPKRQNVKIDGVETEDNNVPLTSGQGAGLVRMQSNGRWGIDYVKNDGRIGIYPATKENVDIRKESYIPNIDYMIRPITPGNLDYSVKAAMCDGKGAPYTETEQASARDRIDAVARKDYDRMKESYERRITNLEYAARGQLYHEDIQDGECYRKDIQSDIMPYGTLDRIGGKTICFNQMLGDSYPKTVEGEYYEQTVEDKAKMFDVDVLGSKSFVWNQLAPKNGYKQYNYTCNIDYLDDGTIIASPVQSGSGGLSVSLRNVFNVGNKHYVRFEAKLINASHDVQVKLGGKVYFSTLEAIFEKYSFVNKADDKVFEIFSSNKDVAYLKKINIFDLTPIEQSLGITIETPEQFESLFPADYYQYSEPTILNADSKQVVSCSADGEIVKTISTESLARKYFPDGMKSAGDAHDYFDFRTGEAVQCIGSVDLGTLNWGYNDAFKVFACVNFKLLYPSFNNLLCSLYNNRKALGDMPWSEDKQIALNYSGGNSGTSSTGNYGNNTLLIKDSDYTDAQSLKNAMSGVMLQYELAEPIRTPLTEEEKSILSSIYCEQAGTITFENSLDNMHIPVPVTETFHLREWAQPLDSTHKYSHNGQLVSGVSEVDVKEGDYLIDMTRAGVEDTNAYVGEYTEKNDGELISADLAEVVSVGRNLFDISKHTDFHSGKVINPLNGKIETWGSSWGYIDYIEIAPNKSYTYKYDLLNSFNNTRGIAIYDKKYNYVGGAYTMKNGTVTFDTPSDAKYCRLSVGIDHINTVQLEEGTVPTSYTPYFSETKPLSDIISKYFPDGMKSAGSVADYIDIENGEAVQVVGSVVLDGSEEWRRYEQRNVYHTMLNDINTRFTYNNNALSDIFELANSAWSDGSEYYKKFGGNNSSNVIYFNMFGSIEVNDITTWKDWLSKHNISLNYALAEPIRTPLSPEDLELLKTLHVEGGGTLTFAQNDDRFHIPVPNKETFLVKTGGNV